MDLVPANSKKPLNFDAILDIIKWYDSQPQTTRRLRFSLRSFLLRLQQMEPKRPRNFNPKETNHVEPTKIPPKPFPSHRGPIPF